MAFWDHWKRIKLQDFWKAKKRALFNNLVISYEWKIITLWKMLCSIVWMMSSIFEQLSKEMESPSPLWKVLLREWKKR